MLEHLRACLLCCTLAVLWSGVTHAETSVEGQAARWEFTGFQAAHGAVLGVEGCLAFGCDGLGSWVVSGLAGGALGAGMAWTFTRWGIEPGLVRSLNAGTSWGFVGGLSLALVGEGPSSNAARMMGAQLAGLALGGALGMTMRPSPRQVSFVSTVGAWAGVVSFLVGNALQWAPGFGLGPLIATGTLLGMGAGVALARFVPTLPDHSLALNVGGTLGVIAGLGVALLFQGAEPTNGVLFGCVLSGAVLGLGAAAFSVR